MDQKARVYSAVAGHWGNEVAEAMMAVLPPNDPEQLATKDEVRNLGVDLRAEMAGLRGEMAELRGEMREFRGEMYAELAKVHARIDRLEAKIDAQFVRLVAFFLPLMFACAGLVLAAVSIA